MKAPSLLLLSALTLPVLAAEPSTPGAFPTRGLFNTSAELFWQRSTDDGTVVEYEVKMNGAVVESRDATSYYTSSLTPGKTYIVSLVAIDDEGDRSAPAVLYFISGDRSDPGHTCNTKHARNPGHACNTNFWRGCTERFDRQCIFQKLGRTFLGPTRFTWI